MSLSRLCYLRASNQILKYLSTSTSLEKNVFNIARTITSTSQSNAQSAAKAVHKPDWNRAVSEAEKIVGYPTSFLSLRWLLSDEIANVALHLRKLVGSNHPLLKTAKNLIYDGKSNMQAWGLIVLLVSKAAGHAPDIPEMEQDKSAGVLHSQRALAEVTEMIRTSHLIHQGLVNLQTLANSGNELSADSEMIFGNKIALLGGDYLLGNACLQLAGLRNQELIELISSAVRDLAESNFIGDRDEQNNALPSDPAMKINATFDENLDELSSTRGIDMSLVLGHPEREWSFRHTLSSGSLLGKSCQGTLKLAGQPITFQKQGYLFGKHLALAWQASMDLEPFRMSEIPHNVSFSLVSAPVLYHLDYDPSLYNEIKKGFHSVENIDYGKIHEVVRNGPGIDQTKELQRKHSQAAMTVLDKFPATDARTALQNIILAMQCL
ncbi:CLUMA_CG009411, isoform A [Clunio marinus]|uniref:CLUMA_CG009411, isoform A n=1 Tax=Clunio marinus TaxID=568069 RepID=A0A1J1I8A6_9DIPT|nr:CLUMA_CG009411, isoform A [Clunio marinus]